MCPEIAAFANAANDGTRHEVELVNDRPFRSERDESGQEVIIAVESNCQHFGYKPGESLCNYLAQHTSFEFLDTNANRAMACLGAAAPTSTPYDVDYEHIQLWSSVARGVRPGVRVGIEYGPGKGGGPPYLKILAEDTNAPAK